MSSGSLRPEVFPTWISVREYPTVPAVVEGPAVQDSYPEDASHCYGCGRLNELGYQIKTRPEDGGTVTEFTPEAFHMAIPGYTYGGLVASIIDCHSTGSAAIFAMQRDGIEVGSELSPRFVTARLEVDYLLPTPLATMVLHGRLVEITGRKVVVDTDLSVGGTVTAKGSAVLVEIPEGRFGTGL
jgi:acyl-coenzyme A thioesterase PaaI-like protein